MSKLKEFLDFLEIRKEEMELDLNKRGQKEATYPEGIVQVKKRKDGTTFFVWIHDGKGEYIPKENMELVKQLAQKSYDGAVLRSEKKEAAAIRRFLKAYEGLVPREELYGHLSEERRALVNPVVMTDEQYVKKWLENQPMPNAWGDTARYQTEKGEFVRSKAEVLIANELFHEGIPYKYEMPLRIDGQRPIYPDFTILDVPSRTEYYWEHFGMMDTESYFRSYVEKMNRYEKSGILRQGRLIATYESNAVPLDTRDIRLRVRNFKKQ